MTSMSSVTASLRAFSGGCEVGREHKKMDDLGQKQAVDTGQDP